MSESLHYFAYGSNLSTRRFLLRLPGAELVCRAVLAGHRMVFRKRGLDGSAKCDIEASRDCEDQVWGVVYRIARDDKPVLDRIEQLGTGYAQMSVSLVSAEAQEITAFTYYALDIDAGLRPFSWYQQHVLRGAREHALDPVYIQAIAAVPSMVDHDQYRHDQELAIYRK